MRPRLLALEMYVAETKRPMLWFRAEDYDPLTGTWPNVAAGMTCDRLPDGTVLVRADRISPGAAAQWVWTP